MEKNFKDCPYKGLLAYNEDDAAFFFGREKDTRLIIANLFTSRLTLVYGASGVGKSSVLQAGVVYELRSREDLRDDVLVVMFNAWQSDPITGLKAKVAAATTGLSDKSAPSPDSISLAEYLATCAKHLNRRLILILDQFEEYFTYHPRDDQPGSFATEFPAVVTRPDLPVSCLLSLREDSLARLDRFEGSIPTLFDNYLRLEHLDYNGAKEAIIKPFEQYNKRYSEPEKEMAIDQDLVEEVINQVQTGQVLIGEVGYGKTPQSKRGDMRVQVETPYLQLVMTRLWEEETRIGSHKLQLRTLNRLDGAKSIVQKHLVDAMNKLEKNEQEMAAKIFRYMVTPSGTKIAYSVPDLAEFAEAPQTQLAPLLDKLGGTDFRILRPVDPPKSTLESFDALSDAFRKLYPVSTGLDKSAIKRYEIFHDVLAKPIFDWRTNYAQAQERAKGEEQLAKERRRAEEQLTQERRRAKQFVALFTAIALGIGLLIGVLSYRFNWFGARSAYLAVKADKKDVIAWLVDEKFKKEVVMDDFSNPGTKRALVALRLAHELDPNNPKTNEYLDHFLNNISVNIRMESAPLKLLQNSLMILQEINQEVPYQPIADEVNSLRIRVMRMINQNQADSLLTELRQQVQDSSVSDETLLKGYKQLLTSYASYTDTVEVKHQITSLQGSIEMLKKLLKMQESDTVTILQQKVSWTQFMAPHRTSPEKSRARQVLQRLDELVSKFASITKEEDFVTCSGVSATGYVPQGISNSFPTGKIFVLATIKAPLGDRVTIKWYDKDKGAPISTFGPYNVVGSGYHLYASKGYDVNQKGLNEVRLYNSQNLLIGRRVFRVR